MMYVATRVPLVGDARYVVEAAGVVTCVPDEETALRLARAYWRRDVDATIRPLGLVVALASSG